MSEKVLQQEIKECIIDRLNLDVNPEDIDDDAPIFSGEDGELLEASKTYTELGKLWKTVAYDLHEASVEEKLLDHKIFSRNYETGEQIMKLENQGIQQLERYLEGGRTCY